MAQRSVSSVWMQDRHLDHLTILRCLREVCDVAMIGFCDHKGERAAESERRI